jgi:hypothetical protein
MKRILPFITGAITVLALAVGVAQPAGATPVFASQGPPGVDTGQYIYNGQALTVTASGLASYGYEGAYPCTGYPQTDPNGQRYLNGAACGAKYDPNAVYPGYIGELLYGVQCGGPGGYVSGWQPAGSYLNTTYYGCNGELVVLYNDSYYPDNFGTYDWTVSLGCPPGLRYPQEVDRCPQ